MGSAFSSSAKLRRSNDRRSFLRSNANAWRVCPKARQSRRSAREKRKGSGERARSCVHRAPLCGVVRCLLAVGIVGSCSALTARSTRTLHRFIRLPSPNVLTSPPVRELIRSAIARESCPLRLGSGNGGTHDRRTDIQSRLSSNHGAIFLSDASRPVHLLCRPRWRGPSNGQARLGGNSRTNASDDPQSANDPGGSRKRPGSCGHGHRVVARLGIFRGNERCL